MREQPNAFFDWLSEETRYLRFMYQAKELTPEIAAGARLHRTDCAACRWSSSRCPAEGDPPAIALGRYAPTDDPR